VKIDTIADILAANGIEDAMWLIEGIIHEGGVTLLTAPGGSGKSYFALQLGLSLSMNVPFLERKMVHSRVLYLNGEDPVQVFRKRARDTMTSLMTMHGINEDPSSRFAYFKCIHLTDCPSVLLDAQSFKTTSVFGEILNHCKDWRPDLVIIDPLISFIAEENRSEYAAQFYRFTKMLAPSLLIVHHHTKNGVNGEGDHRSWARGSSAWVENSRVHLMLADKTLITVKNNYSPDKMQTTLAFRNGFFTVCEDIAPVSMKKQGRPRKWKNICQ